MTTASEPPRPSENIAELLTAWLSWLRARHPRLDSVHMDIVQQTAADLLQWQTEQLEQSSPDLLQKIGFRILQRRVADVFRDPVKRWASLEIPDIALLVETSSTASNDEPLHALEADRFIKALIDLLADLEPSDRALLLRAADPAVGASPLTIAKRQRLSRLRKQMRRTLRVRHGIDLEK